MPEEHVRAALASAIRVPPGDTFAFLAAYGLDCAGAVSFAPWGAAREPPGGVRWMTHLELHDTLDGLPTAPLGAEPELGIRLSLGGLQGKLVVVHDGVRFGKPEGDTPSTHILKPSPLLGSGRERWPGLPHAEHFAMTTAKLACEKGGLELRVPQTKVVSVEGRDVLVVERCDRQQADGKSERIHQEDFCQALGLVSKYEDGNLGDPSLRKIASVLTAYSGGGARRALLERTILSLVLGDGDMHARNVSVVLSRGAVSLTPAYDIVPTRTTLNATGHNADHRLGLRINGEIGLDDVTRADVVEETMSWGMRERPAITVIDRTLTAVAAHLEEAQKWCSDHEVVAAAATYAARRCAELL